jgi:hypothetical protein
MTDEQQEQVRRLLAEARHDEPMPADVAERLDRVLAGLADEPGRSATVVRLADRRRRAARMLVAAAAVVAVGVGGAQFVSGMGGSMESESTAGSTEEEAPAASADEGGAAPEALQGDGVSITRPYELRSQRFARDAEELQALTFDADVASENDGDGAPRGGAAAYDSSLRRAAKQSLCEPGDWGRGGFFPVVYDGAPGWMVLRPEAGDTQVADLFLCGSDQAVRSVTLPVR